MKKEFDEKNATVDEIWEYCMLEYNNANPITKKLINNFYKKIGKIINEFDKEDKILEVGCGPGESSRRIIKMLNGQQFEASDYDERYIKKQNELFPENKVSVESVYELKRSNKEFDRVIMLEVLEHLEDKEKALNELFRVAKKSVIISVPNEPLWRILNMIRFKYLSDLGNTPGHINHFNEWGLRNLLGKYGEISKVYKPMPWLIMECKVRN